MRRPLAIGGLALALALPLLSPATADAASCRSRKATGTVLGGVGGALLGGAVTHGGAGPILGGVGGALVGREIGRSGCDRPRAVAYRAPARAQQAAPAPRPARYVYYDQYGNPVAAGPATTPVRYTSSCRDEVRSFYDERGRLAHRSVQVCDR